MISNKLLVKSRNLKIICYLTFYIILYSAKKIIYYLTTKGFEPLPQVETGLDLENHLIPAP